MASVGAGARVMVSWSPFLKLQFLSASTVVAHKEAVNNHLFVCCFETGALSIDTLSIILSTDMLKDGAE